MLVLTRQSISAMRADITVETIPTLTKLKPSENHVTFYFFNMLQKNIAHKRTFPEILFQNEVLLSTLSFTKKGLTRFCIVYPGDLRNTVGNNHS